MDRIRYPSHGCHSDLLFVTGPSVPRAAQQHVGQLMAGVCAQLARQAAEDSAKPLDGVVHVRPDRHVADIARITTLFITEPAWHLSLRLAATPHRLVGTRRFRLQVLTHRAICVSVCVDERLQMGPLVVSNG